MDFTFISEILYLVLLAKQGKEIQNKEMTVSNVDMFIYMTLLIKQQNVLDELIY